MLFADKLIKQHAAVNKDRDAGICIYIYGLMIQWMLYVQDNLTLGRAQVELMYRIARIEERRDSHLCTHWRDHLGQVSRAHARTPQHAQSHEQQSESSHKTGGWVTSTVRQTRVQRQSSNYKSK